MNNTSAFAKIDWNDMRNIAAHLAISALVSFALYLINTAVPQIDFGPYTALAAPVVSTLSAAIKRYLTDYQAQ